MPANKFSSTLQKMANSQSWAVWYNAVKRELKSDGRRIEDKPESFWKDLWNQGVTSTAASMKFSSTLQKMAVVIPKDANGQQLRIAQRVKCTQANDEVDVGERGEIAGFNEGSDKVVVSWFGGGATTISARHIAGY